MAKIPEKKHGADELQSMRNRNAFAVNPPIAHLQAQALHPFLLGVCYFIAFLGAGLALWALDPNSLIDENLLIAGLGCSAFTMLSALIIFWKKPRSRHHAAILSIISLLVLVFGPVYYIDQTESNAHENAQGPIRY